MVILSRALIFLRLFGDESDAYVRPVDPNQLASAKCQAGGR
jgi:hypothetical protein